MDATATIRTIRLGPDAYAYPDIDSAAWECVPVSKPLTDVEWRRITRAPAHGKHRHIDLLAQAPQIEVGRLDGARDVEADCLQVLDELYRIAYRKEWRICTLKDPNAVDRDPDGPPVVVEFMVSPWVTASSITIGKWIRRSRKRVSACIQAMDGLLDIDRQRTSAGRWRTRARIVMPLELFTVNLLAWKKLSEDKKARRVKAMQAPVKAPKDLHERHANLERIDHGVAACDVGRFTVARSDRAATQRAAQGAKHIDEDFPEVTRKGSHADQLPDAPVKLVADLTNDVRVIARKVGLHRKWSDRALEHDPHLLYALCDDAMRRNAKRKLGNCAAYVRSEWRRHQAAMVAGEQVVKVGKQVVHAPEDYDEDDGYGDGDSYARTSDEATI